MALLLLPNRFHGILVELNNSKKENGAVEVPHHKRPWLFSGRQEQPESLSNTKAISYKVPEFVPPFPLRVHPMAEEALESTKGWLLRHSIDTLYSPQMIERLLFCPALSARISPDASWKGVEVSGKLMTFITLMDDIFDDFDFHKAWERGPSLFREINLVMASTFSRDETIMPEYLLRGFEFQYASDQLNKAIKHLVSTSEVFETYDDAVAVFPGKLSPLGSAFREVWDEIVTETRRESCLRIARYVQMFCTLSVIQIHNNKDDVIPSLHDYLLTRRATSAVAVFVVLADLTDGVALPEDLFATPEIQRLLVLTTDFAAWHNDIWSFKKEYLINGDVNNLVFLIGHHYDCSFSEASLTVTKMLKEVCEEIEDAAEEVLKATPPQHQNAASRYVAACRHWVSGTDDWHKKNLRYR